MKKSILAIALASTLLSACGGGGSDNSPQSQGGGGDIFDVEPATLTAYNPSVAHAGSIVGCVTTDSCALNTLPLIGLDHDAPTVDDIMDHVVISHEWMGQRFRDMLSAMPQEMLLLFRAVTAVVISADIRPSHYKSATGAIYIDPALLWLTNAEKATIDQTPDFRSGFGKDLQFVRVWRYVINNDFAWQSYSLTGTEERTLGDTLVLGSWLFYHELAHANDCASPANMVSFDRTSSFVDNYTEMVNNQNCVYQQLTNQMPLQSQIWLDLGQVFFQGADSTSTQRAMTPTEAGDAFALDHAHDGYSYSSVREDVAMAFEEVMMKRQFGADRDMVIIPQFQDFSCDNAGIKWGQRGRMAVPEVKVRSEFVSDRILPDVALDSFYQNLPDVTQIAFDHNWCEPNLGLKLRGTDAFDSKAADQINHGMVID